MKQWWLWGIVALAAVLGVTLFVKAPRFTPNYPPNKELDAFINPPPAPPIYTANNGEVIEKGMKLKLAAIYDRVQKKLYNADGSERTKKEAEDFAATHFAESYTKTTFVFEHDGLPPSWFNLYLIKGKKENLEGGAFVSPRVQGPGTPLIFDSEDQLNGEDISFDASLFDGEKHVARFVFNVPGSDQAKKAEAPR